MTMLKYAGSVLAITCILWVIANIVEMIVEEMEEHDDFED